MGGREVDLLRREGNHHHSEADKDHDKADQVCKGKVLDEVLEYGRGVRRS